LCRFVWSVFFFQAEDGIRDFHVTGVQTCALPISVNFGFLYGMGANKFVRYAFDEYQVNFTFEEATAVREKYFRLYRGLKAWHREVEDHVRRVGSVTSPMGMVRRLPDIASTDKFLQAEAVRQGINFGVQSAAGQLTLAAMVLVHEKLDP